MIEIKSVSKRFPVGREWEVLFDDLSLTIPRGEFVALTGQSGCGKSTLLNMIGGLDQPDSGEVIVSGTVMGKLSAARRARFLNKHVGFIFQAHHLLPEETALGNVVLPMRIGGNGGRKARQRAAELLERLGLGNRLHAYPTTLSGGEKQRVAIARALANKPEVLLADEPTGSLNPEYKEAVFQDLLEMSRSEGATVVMVTHDIELISGPNGLRVDRNVDVKELARQGKPVPVEVGGT